MTRAWLKTTVFVAKQLIFDMLRCDLFKHAYSMAYVTLMSLIPSLAVLFSLFSLFSPEVTGAQSMVDQVKNYILANLATSSGPTAIQYLEESIGRLDLKKIGATGFAGMLVTLVLLLRQIEMALNRIFLVRQSRSHLLRFIYFWSFLTLGSFIGSLAIGVTSGFNLQSILDRTHAPTGGFAWLVPTLLLFAIFVLIYKLVPNCPVTAKAAAVGAAVATFLIKGAAAMFGFYLSLAKYQAIYGALAALPIFLFWLYLLWVIILLGAVVAWRYGQGLSKTKPIKDAPDENVPLLRTQLESQAPFLVLAAIHAKFQTGQSQKARGIDLVQELHLTKAWVKGALQTLEQLGYIVPKNPDKASDTMTVVFYPTSAAEAVNMSTFQQDLVKDAQAWLNFWHEKTPPGVQAMGRWLTAPKPEQNKLTLGTVLGATPK